MACFSHTAWVSAFLHTENHSHGTILCSSWVLGRPSCFSPAFINIFPCSYPPKREHICIIKYKYDPFTPKSQCSHGPAWLRISWKCRHVVGKALIDQALLYCHLHDSLLPQTHIATSQTAPVSHNLSRFHAADIWFWSNYLPSKMCTFSPLPRLSHSSSWIQNPGAMWTLPAPSYSVKGSNHWPADFLTPL